METSRLRGIHQEMLLVQDIEVREALIMSSQMVKFIEDLCYVILLDVHMGRFLQNLVIVHWEGYLVQIV